MGYNELFEHQGHQHKYKREDAHDYRPHSQYRDEDQQFYRGYERTFNLSHILAKIKASRNLKLLIGVLGVIILATVIILAIVLLPLLVKLVNFVSQYGIQGVIDTVSGVLDKIWKGAGK